MNSKPKILAILGPTASGKSDLAISVAKKFNGEIISADSRQVYKGLNIGTGKITRKEMCGVPHHLLDVADPKKRFTVVRYKEMADEAIQKILARGKLPIVCGGTGFYIQAVVDNIVLPDVQPNKKLRQKLWKKSTGALYAEIKKLDPARAKMLDPKNKVRLIRAIEIATALGKVPKVKMKPEYETLQIGIKIDSIELKEKIKTRLAKRFKAGMLSEAKKLHKRSLSWKRMEELGLEYRFMALHLQGKISHEEMMKKLESEIWAYARRQMTWFNANKKIAWIALKEKRIIENSVKKFLGGR